jgi:hypothetical protein
MRTQKGVQMRRWSFCSAWLRATVALIVLSTAVKSQTVANSLPVYDENPAHIWNRLYVALRVRTDQQGNIYGVDSLDPMLWETSEQLLSQPSHGVALRVMDEFLRTHAETQIQDPLKRALLQHDLWAVFDWSVEQSRIKAPKYVREIRELQTRLAEVLKRVALTPAQIKFLPDNYAQAVASGAFAAKYNPAQPQQPFLPPDLFDPSGPWVCVTPSPESFGNGGVAKVHFGSVSGRSIFLVFVRLPEGRQATLDYFQTLWNFPQPWVANQAASAQSRPNPDLPTFPAGTQVALVRQMMLFDDHGNVVVSPVVESLQMRIYREITTTPVNFISATPTATLRRSGQDFFEFTLSRSLLFSGTHGGLRATGPDDSGPSTFMTHGQDEIDGNSPMRARQFGHTMQRCVNCHSGGGLNSFNSLDSLLKPMRSQLEHQDVNYGPRYWSEENAIWWKEHRYDWGLLNGYWN